MTEEQYALLIRLDEKMTTLNKRVDEMDLKVSNLDKISTKIGGALLVVVFIGSSLVWLYDKVISKLWHLPS